MATTVFDVLAGKIQDLKKDTVTHLTDGAAKDYARYREGCGRIRGLNDALREIEDLSRNYMDDEDD
jgi:hypothetical protein